MQLPFVYTNETLEKLIFSFESVENHSGHFILCNAIPLLASSP